MKLLRIINFAHLFGIIWLIALAAFVGTILHGIFISRGITEQHSTVLVFVVLTGLFAFLGASVLYLIHYLFLRKKLAVGTPRSPRIAPLLLVALMVLLFGVVAVKAAYNLGHANKLRETKNSSETTNSQPSAVNEKVRYVESKPAIVEPSPTPVQNTQPQTNLVSCSVYGQTFNLTPEKCRYYQSEEAGANKGLNSGSYTPPTQYGTAQTSTPIPTIAPEKYHSTQEECRKTCYATYQNQPDTSLFKQQCVNNCSSK